VGTVTVGHLGEAGLQECNDTPRDGSEQLRPVQSGLEILVSAIAPAKLAQVVSGGDAKEARGIEEGSVCEALSWLVIEISDAEMDGERGIGGGANFGAIGPRRFFARRATDGDVNGARA
jgi:hypothetical protein